jgi:hypothetical protein
VDLGEQAADAVADPGGLGGLVVVETDEHAELGEHLLADVDPAQRVRHGAGGLGDDVGVPGVGLGRARMQVGDPAHGQPGQVGDLAADRAGDRDRQRADGGRLVDHDQHRPVSLQAGEQLAQPSLVLGQCRVVQPGPGRVQRHGVVGDLADVEPAEDRVAALTHPCAPRISSFRPGRSSTGCRQPRYEETSPQAVMSLSAVHQCHQAR